MKRAFAVGLLGATILPALPLPGLLEPLAARGMDFLSLGHVLGTGYLLSDPEFRALVRTHPGRLVLTPLLLIVAGVALLSDPRSPLFTPCLFAFVLWQAWHFGVQNVGVATFASFGDRGRGLDLSERRLILAGTVCGVLGTLRSFTPYFHLSRAVVALEDWQFKVVDALYAIGTVGAVVVTAVTVIVTLRALRRGHVLFAALMGPCTLFLLPMFLSKAHAHGIGLYGTAHGLQYCAFLTVHSINARARGPFLKAPLLLLATLALGCATWRLVPPVGFYDAPLLGYGTIFGIASAHFWVDRAVWRLRDPHLGKWARSRYGKLLKPHEGRD